MKFHSYFDGKTQFSKIFLGCIFFLFFFFFFLGGGGWSGGRQITESFTCASMVGNGYQMHVRIFLFKNLSYVMTKFLLSNVDTTKTRTTSILIIALAMCSAKKCHIYFKTSSYTSYVYPDMVRGAKSTENTLLAYFPHLTVCFHFQNEKSRHEFRAVQ